MTEKQRYEVLRQFDGFELRHYPACLLATVTVEGDFAAAATQGFYPLVSYISGENQRSQKIAMTAPVIQNSDLPKRHDISFVLPANYQLSDLPIPSNAKVRVHTMDAHNAVVRKFTGRWTQKRFYEQGEQLKLSLDKCLKNGELSASVLSEVYFARFDPPWTPGFVRRNEALLRVKISAL